MTYTDIGGGGKLPPHGEDYFNRIVNVHWPKKAATTPLGCRFAVCGYDGNYASEGFTDPVHFGVGAYSNDGKTWTNFRAFENGSMVSAFYMVNPYDMQELFIVGGGINDDSGEESRSTASLRTLLGAGPSAEGGSSRGRNVANYGSIGYDKDANVIYAVENSGAALDVVNTPKLHTFRLGATIPSKPTEKAPISWAGPLYPGIGPIYKCDAPMTFKDKEGADHALDYGESFPVQLMLDGRDITPPGSRGVFSAAGGINDDGETIIIAVGYHLVGTDDHAIAWCSVGGARWLEIGGIWSGAGVLQFPAMASAVPSLRVTP